MLLPNLFRLDKYPCASSLLIILLIPSTLIEHFLDSDINDGQQRSSSFAESQMANKTSFSEDCNNVENANDKSFTLISLAFVLASFIRGSHASG